MDYHQNARLTIHSREQLARSVVEQGLTLKLAAVRFQVSPKTAAKWVRRYREAGRSGLGDRTSRPHRCPRATSSTLLERFLALRRLRYNGWRIGQALGLSRTTVSRILRRAGMNRLRSLDARTIRSQPASATFLRRSLAIHSRQSSASAGTTRSAGQRISANHPQKLSHKKVDTSCAERRT